MKQDRKLITQEDRFAILHRDKFTCRYCGAKPGSSDLEVDHLIPHSMGGSNSPLNLVAACKSCNRKRSDAAIFPHDLIIGVDDMGWAIIKQWGIWTIKASHDSVAVCGGVYGSKHDPRLTGGGMREYWFEIRRAHERDWESHISEKDWPKPHLYSDFLQCLAFAREVTSPRSLEVGNV